MKSGKQKTERRQEMGNRKLVICCIAGIVLGFLAPFALPVLRSTSLSIGMVAGLGIGYLLDISDEKRSKSAGNAAISQKAGEANRLLEQARAEIQGKPYDEDEAEADPVEEPQEEEYSDVNELSPEEESEKLNEAEVLLRKARERMK